MHLDIFNAPVERVLIKESYFHHNTSLYFVTMIAYSSWDGSHNLSYLISRGRKNYMNTSSMCYPKHRYSILLHRHRQRVYRCLVSVRPFGFICCNTLLQIADHLIRHQAVKLSVCDCKWPFHLPKGLCIGMFGLTYSLYTPEGYTGSVRYLNTSELSWWGN